MAVRSGNGKFTKDPDTAERDAQACQLRVQALSYAEIAEKLGYADQGHAHRAVQRALKATMQEAADELRVVELKRLDSMFKLALKVANRAHVTVSNGRVVYLEDTPLEDDGPALAAIDRLLKIQERRARLLGLDAPVKHEVRNVDAVDAEIELLVARLAAGGQGPVAPEAPARAEAGGVPHPG